MNKNAQTDVDTVHENSLAHGMFSNEDGRDHSSQLLSQQGLLKGGTKPEQAMLQTKDVRPKM